MTTYMDRMDSPVGELTLLSDGERLTGLYMHEQKRGPDIDPAWVIDAAPFERVREQLDAYFAGELREFDIELGLRGSEFQVAAWQELCRIPYGETITYAELARRIGKPAAVRAAGAANGRNRLGIIVPCHRVIGANGTLTGYAGGLERKRWLLDFERTRREG